MRRALINSLCEGPLVGLEAWAEELRLMERIDRKADIEALYTLHGPATVAVGHLPSDWCRAGHGVPHLHTCWHVAHNGMWM